MKYDFLILGFGEINKVWTNPQWTAYTLAKKGFKVAYINPPAYRKIRFNDINRIISRFSSNKIQRNHTNFDIFSSYASMNLPFKLFNTFEKKRLNKLIQNSKNIICCQSLWLKFANLSNENTTFFLFDDYSALKNSSKEQSNYDIKVNNFNKVAVTNKNLIKKYPKAIFSPNCISYYHFNDNLKTIKKQKIENQVCFVGALHSEKIDMNKIINLIKCNPNYNFIFAGKLFGFNNSDLPSLPNFQYVGELPFNKAIKLMKESKFGLIPFVNNSYTNHVFSMKYFEYIASYTYPVCSKIPMYDSLNSNLIPKTFLDDETNINSFKSSDLEFMRKIVLKKYTYNARIKDMIERKYLIN